MKCQVCGNTVDKATSYYHTDYQFMVHGCCEICSGMEALPLDIIERIDTEGNPITDSTVYYEKETDTYRYYLTKRLYEIVTQSKKKFDTRLECLEYLIKIREEVRV